MPDLTKVFLGNDTKTWLIALGIAVGSLLVLRLVEQILVVRIQRFTRKTRTIVDDVLVGALRKTKFLYLIIVSLYLGSRALSLPDKLGSIDSTILVVTTWIQAGIWASTGLKIWLENYRATEEDGANRTTMNALSFLARVALWTTILLLVLDNMGIDVTALVTGLGIGGVAVALAVQNVLSDLFASLSIVLDKPFVNGDFIVVGDLAGSVEYVGVKTTRIRSLSGEQLVFSNNDLLTSRIRNFGRMNERRVVFQLGVTYQTTAETLERIPGIIREVVEAQEHVRFDRSHFASYGDFSLNFETVYYVGSSDYTQHMDILQTINLELYRRFATEGIEFAYPTQTLFIQKEG